MADTSTIPPQETEIKQEVTLESLDAKLDMLGEQMNWLCENLAGVFQLVGQLGENGGGLMGMMKMMKGGPVIDATTTEGEQQ